MKKILMLCLALLPALPGCDTAPLADEAQAPRVILFETVGEAAGFVLTQPGTEVIRNQAAWTALWEQAWGITDADGLKTPPPAIDFDASMVVAVFWGSGFSGCSNAVQAIETIVRREGEIIVVVGPLPNLGFCDALVYPVQMVQLDRADLPVIFEGEVPGTGRR